MWLQSCSVLTTLCPPFPALLIGCVAGYVCDAALGRGYDDEGGAEDVSGFLFITITTDTFVLHLPSLPRRRAIDSRWTDTQNSPTQPQVSFFSQKMASKCPKCDKTVYFGKFYAGSVEMIQKLNRRPAGWRLYLLLSMFIWNKMIKPVKRGYF